MSAAARRRPRTEMRSQAADDDSLRPGRLARSDDLRGEALEVRRLQTATAKPLEEREHRKALQLGDRRLHSGSEQAVERGMSTIEAALGGGVERGRPLAVQCERRADEDVGRGRVAGRLDTEERIERGQRVPPARAGTEQGRRVVLERRLGPRWAASDRSPARSRTRTGQTRRRVRPWFDRLAAATVAGCANALDALALCPHQRSLSWVDVLQRAHGASPEQRS